jgi:hypothetical protein
MPSVAQIDASLPQLTAFDSLKKTNGNELFQNGITNNKRHLNGIENYQTDNLKNSERNGNHIGNGYTNGNGHINGNGLHEEVG